MALFHHVTWSINSICHMFGTKPFKTKDHSTNFAPLALLSLGESWHSYHHANPASARHGVLPRQVDLSARMIRVFEQARLGDAGALARARADRSPRSRGERTKYSLIVAVRNRPRSRHAFTLSSIFVDVRAA